jgi:hypothetical protein
MLKDARREPRYPAEGIVRIFFRNPQERSVEGRLVDLSESGFRIAHSSHDLHPGQVVEFRRQGAEGSARVVWNRILDNTVETGFLLLALRPTGAK